MATSSINDLRLEVIKAVAAHRFKGYEIRMMKLQSIREDKKITELNEEECRIILDELRGAK